MRAIILGFLFVAMVSPSVLTAQTVSNGGSNGRESVKPVDIVRDPADVPAPIPNRPPAVVHVTLTTQEVIGQLDPAAGTTYRFWTFNGKVPGPMIRVKQGDTVEVTVKNDPKSRMVHSVDLHAAFGPGGGAAMSQAAPGETKTFSFRATVPGLYVYHCGTQMIAEHIANGMYGLILVEPEGGLPHADHEYYVMQGEIYTTAAKGKAGLQQFNNADLMQEKPEYFVFNGAVDALRKAHPMKANVGETVRIFFGDAGPNATSSLHMVGQIFTKDFVMGSLTSAPLTGIQTASIPPGSAAIFELNANMPGQFPLMDHAMARMAKGLMAILDVSGATDASLMRAGPADAEAGSVAASLSGMSPQDTADAQNGFTSRQPSSTENAQPMLSNSTADSMPDMDMPKAPAKPASTRSADTDSKPAPSAAVTKLDGCMTLLTDGKVTLRTLDSHRVYRLEAQPLLFSEHANRLVRVTGEFGSVMAVEDPSLPSFVVKTVDRLASDCNAKLTRTSIEKFLGSARGAAPAVPGKVGMGDLSFAAPTITIHPGQKVTWENSSQTVHNVVADAGKATNPADVHLPVGESSFDSGYMQPGQSYSRVFKTPGVYRYVCTLHEGNGMKGVILVK